MDSPASAFAGPSPAPGPERPSGLTALCVLTLVLGALGISFALLSLLTLVVHLAGGATFAAGPGMTPEMAELQNEMQAATAAVVTKYLPYSLAGLALQIGLCAAFIYGGVQTLRLREPGRGVLLKAFVAALVIEPIRTVLLVLNTYDSYTVTQPFMARMMDPAAAPGPAPPAQLSAVMGQVMLLLMIATIIFYIVWLLAKCGYFLWARSYLRQSEIARLFS